jgi:hypothetical protein
MIPDFGMTDGRIIIVRTADRPELLAVARWLWQEFLATGLFNPEPWAPRS